jgi:hypothetical protein
MLELGMLFLQVKGFMTMRERLCKVRSTLCVNRRGIAHIRLEPVVGADNLFSLTAIFGQGHSAIKVEEQWM